MKKEGKNLRQYFGLTLYKHFLGLVTVKIILIQTATPLNWPLCSLFSKLHLQSK